jgi:hypothetical protein
MFSVKCDKCGGTLLLDDAATMENYLKDDVVYRLFDDGVLDESVIQDYLIYVCEDCREIYKFNYRDWESRFRREIALAVMELKKREALRKVNPETISEDSGLEFCGQCFGFSGDGYCLKDMIKQCTLRK